MRTTVGSRGQRHGLPMPTATALLGRVGRIHSNVAATSVYLDDLRATGLDGVLANFSFIPISLRNQFWRQMVGIALARLLERNGKFSRRFLTAQVREYQCQKCCSGVAHDAPRPTILLPLGTRVRAMTGNMSIKHSAEPVNRVPIGARNAHLQPMRRRCRTSRRGRLRHTYDDGAFSIHQSRDISQNRRFNSVHAFFLQLCTPAMR